ncbi:MAG: class B sortase [Lachnospiraceae bacterium]|nr:class B sortase [Lachnospiraceae bacterium]
MKRKIYVLSFLVFAVLFFFSGAMILRDRIRSKNEKEANLLLAQKMRQDAETGEGDFESEIREEAPGKKAEENLILPEYRELWEQNKDMAGWLTAEDLGIDYAVMYTPKEPEYYLHRGFSKEEAVSGSLFIGEGWKPEGGNTIIYGHHMKDGTMFGQLDEYSYWEYAKEHPNIRFDTLTEKGEYQIVAAFYSRIHGLEDKDAFRYYWYVDLSDRERFEEYMEKVKAASIYDTGVEAVYGDKLLTLSTCSYHAKEGRFVVVAKKTG